MRSTPYTFVLSALLFTACAAADEVDDAAALDPTFGNAGKVIISAAAENAAASSATVVEVAAQADGKIVLAGNDDQNDIFVARLNTDGSLDSSFRDGGFARYCCGIADAIALRPDGRILMAYHSPANGALFVLQLLANGADDSAFGLGRGYTYVQPAAGDTLYGGRMLVQGDGSIALAGTYHQASTNNNEFFFDRVAVDGMSNTPFQFEFGSGSNQDDHAFGVAIDRQGRYLVAGYHRGAAGNYDCAVIRITADLYDVDRTFGYRSPDDYGYQTVAFDYGGDDFDSCNDVIVQNDYIILGGNATHPTSGGTYQAAALALLDDSGELVTLPSMTYPKFAFAYGLSNAGKINTIGKLIADPYETKYPYVYAVGSGAITGVPYGTTAGVARLELPASVTFSIDPHFNGGSPANVYFAERHDGIGALTTMNNGNSAVFDKGKLVVVGSTYGNIAIARFAPFDGILKNGFDVPLY